MTPQRQCRQCLLLHATSINLGAKPPEFSNIKASTFNYRTGTMKLILLPQLMIISISDHHGLSSTVLAHRSHIGYPYHELSSYASTHREHFCLGQKIYKQVAKCEMNKSISSLIRSHIKSLNTSTTFGISSSSSESDCSQPRLQYSNQHTYTLHLSPQLPTDFP
jgi:hypothetical protein